MRSLADLTKDLEKRGEETVRAQLMRGDYGLPGTGNATYEHVREWLSSKESERSEARAEENLSISRRALLISKWAIVLAITAIVLTIIIAWLQRK